MRTLPLALALLAASASAQTPSWTPLPTSGASVSLTADKAFFDGGNEGLGAATSAWFLGTSQPVGPGLRVTGDLPFSFVSYEGGQGEESGAAVGNLRVGVEADVRPGLALGLSLRLPTASGGETDETQNALAYASFTTYDRIGAFLPDVATVSALGEYWARSSAAPALALRFRAEPQVLVPTADNRDGVDETEVLAGYAAHAFYEAGRGRVGLGVSGLSILTQDTDDRHEVAVGALADVAVGAFRPGLVVRAPVAGTLDNFVDTVVGLSLSYTVR